MQLHEFVNEREPEARAFVSPALIAAPETEPFEQMRLCFGRNSNTGIVHGKFDALADRQQGDANLADEREFERIRKEVEYNLLPHGAVDKDRLFERQAIDDEVQTRAFNR